MPFRYGIATASEILHLMVRIEFDIDGKRVVGRAADHLAPKWFTKDPATRYEDDAQDLRNAVAAACLFAEGISESDSAFYLWKKLYDAPQPFSPVPLVHSFACSFVERAAIDAACRATGQTFAATFNPLRSLIVPVW